jgi:hypothetical protein
MGWCANGQQKLRLARNRSTFFLAKPNAEQDERSCSE